MVQEGWTGAGWPQQWADGTQRNTSTRAISVSCLDFVLFKNHLERRLLQRLGTDAWKPSSYMPQGSESNALKCVEVCKY